MELKKTPQADLERGKGLSVLLGLVVALSVLFMGLEWGTATASDNNGDDALNIADMEDALFIPEQQEQQPEPEPPAPEEVIEVQLPEEFKVVDNNKEVAKLDLISADQDRELPPPAPIINTPTVEEVVEEQIFEIVEEQAVPPTGDVASLLKWIGKHIKYPDRAANNGVQGKVIVRFVVEKDGSLTDVQVAKPVDPDLDKEAIRVVKSMDKWKPGKQRGKPVRSRFTLPIQFKLQ